MNGLRGARVPIVLGALLAFGILQAAELREATTSAWQQYVRAAEKVVKTRIDGSGRLLWIEDEPNRKQLVRSGRFVVEPMIGKGTRKVPHGLIHHWIGAVFIPHATLASVRQVVQDYANYKHVYRPPILDSAVLASGNEPDSFSLVTLHRALLVTAVYEAQYEVREFPVDQRRHYTITSTKRVQEIENYGQPEQRMIPPGQGRGFAWKLHTITRYQEEDGGVYMEIEAMALSRDIPVALHWLVNPVVSRLSHDTLLDSMRQTSEAVATMSGEDRQRPRPIGSQSMERALAPR